MLRRLLVVGTLALAAQAHAAEAGKVIFVAGAVKIADRPAAEGASVQENELISTQADGFVYIRTVDNGLFILRPNTKAKIAAYRVDTVNPANTQVKLELISGVARSKSGDAVKKARQNFRFNTPVAAIGVRGTDFTVFTDQNISRVAVLTGGVVVSGFVGACRPDGTGPCEGAASRELSAAQRGQLLQVQRGQSAPQLLQGGANAPDLVSPPRTDEPVAKTGGNSSSQLPNEPSLDPKKNQALNQLVMQPPPSQGGGSKPGQGSQGPGVDIPPPVMTTPDPEPVPPVPVVEKQIIWGRWQAFAGHPAAVDLPGNINAGNTLLATKRNYALFLTPGADYVADTRGSVGFDLKASDAYIYIDGSRTNPQRAGVSNGQLTVDFGARTFATGFDLTSEGGETFKMRAEGAVTANGGLFGNAAYQAPTNMSVEGVLSRENGGAAAYLFDARIDPNRTVNGATYWGARK